MDRVAERALSIVIPVAFYCRSSLGVIIALYDLGSLKKINMMTIN